MMFQVVAKYKTERVLNLLVSAFGRSWHLSRCPGELGEDCYQCNSFRWYSQCREFPSVEEGIESFLERFPFWGIEFPTKACDQEIYFFHNAIKKPMGPYYDLWGS